MGLGLSGGGGGGLGRKVPMPRAAWRKPLQGSLSSPPGRRASEDGSVKRPRVDGLSQECRLVEEWLAWGPCP